MRAINMFIEILTLIIRVTVVSFFFLTLFRRRSKFKEKILISEEKDDERINVIEEKLDKYVIEEEKATMKNKLEKISEIMADAQRKIDSDVEKKVKVAETQFKHKEIKKIKKAEKRYDGFSSKLQSAMPSSEEERVKDMNNLKDAISILESYDEGYYKAPPKKFDAGVGIFYDKMSRQFKSIIAECKLNNYKLIPLQRLKFHIFLQNKSLKNKDILPILNAMKDTRMLGDLIEINSVFHVIVFSDEKVEFSLPEKVLLTFAYDEDLTIQKLLELTEWTESHANEVVKSLSEKNIVMVYNDKLIVGGFGQLNDRREWERIIKERRLDVKIQEAKRYRQQTERKERLKKHLEKVEKAEITTPTPKVTKKEKISEKQKLKEVQEIKDKDDLVSAMEALDDIMPTKIEVQTKSGEDEKPSLEDLIPEKILNYHEKFSIINGGFVQYEKIKKYVIEELGKIPDDLLEAMLNQLKELRMILGSIEIGNKIFYKFNEISLSENEKSMIKYALNKKLMKKENFMKGLKWDEEETLLTMKNLQEKGILRIEKDKITIPGIIQKK